MDALRYVLYDHCLQPPERDRDSGGPNKEAFPGQKQLEKRLKAAFPHVEKNSAGELEVTGTDGTTKIIVFRYRGDGTTAFGGIKEELLKEFDKGDLLILTIVANGSDSGSYRWREVTQKPKPKRPGGSWSYSKGLLPKESETVDGCINKIVSHVVKRLGGTNA